MAEAPDARDRWNDRYRTALDGDERPAAFDEVLHLLPRRGRALDVAGGRGVVAVALAGMGLDVTLADVSDVALSLAGGRAEAAGATIDVRRSDVECEPLPAGPWDLICCFHFLHRPLFPDLVAALAPGGLLVVGIATVDNLERHDRPPRGFLLERSEILSLTGGLEVIHHREEWNRSGSHEAVYVGRRP